MGVAAEVASSIGDELDVEAASASGAALRVEFESDVGTAPAAGGVSNAGAAAASGAATHANAAPCALCDPRIARSRLALREAFVELMQQRGFDGFTVNDLCQRAGLNRGTFYNHFRDKDGLLATFEGEVLADLEAFRPKFQAVGLSDLALYRVGKRPLPVLVELFDYLREQGAFLRAVLGPHGDPGFGLRLREVVCGEFVRSLLHARYRESDEPFVRYYVAYYSGAYLGVISEWLLGGMRESSRDMAVISMRLLFMKPGESIRL